jgi:FkbM family methyltransferase
LSSRDRFASYTALEPDPPNFEALQRYVSSLPSDVASRIELLALAAYSSRQRMRIAWSGSAAAALVSADGPPDPSDVECVTLDELFAGRRMSFLKLDIEGAEPDAITGAAAVIRRDRPIIAVCVYHLQNHLWRIPLLIASLVGDYRFHLRPYNEEGWDLVCYAVPRERSLTSGE